jgi:hypothetical protein
LAKQDFGLYLLDSLATPYFMNVWPAKQSLNDYDKTIFQMRFCTCDVWATWEANPSALQCHLRKVLTLLGFATYGGTSLCTTLPNYWQQQKPPSDPVLCG